MKILNLKKRTAFVLEEVILAVVVISLVVFLCVYFVEKNYKRSYFYNQFANSYNVINRALTKSMVYNGPIENWAWSSDADLMFENYFKQYLKIKKNCKNARDMGCFASGGSAYRFLNGAYAGENIDRRANRYILTNGTSIQFDVSKERCVENYKPCARFLVDTNGEKGPNILGKDLFEFFVFPKTSRLIPRGTYKDGGINEGAWQNNEWVKLDGDSIYNNCNLKCTEGACGAYCGARLMLEGEMNY